MVTVNKGKKPETDRERFTRSNAPGGQALSYIGETGKNLNRRLTKHKRATRNGDANNPFFAVHYQLTNQKIDWDRQTTNDRQTDKWTSIRSANLTNNLRPSNADQFDHL